MKNNYSRKKKLAVFASGNGSNFEVIAQACADGKLDAEIVLLVCDKPGAYVCERASKFGIETFVSRPKECGSKEAFEAKTVGLLQEKGVELICLAGYMRILSDVMLTAYEGKIINIHPSLLPAFKGAHAIKDAFEYGVKVYGVTVHYVNSELDGGEIIAQRAFSYEGSDIEVLEEMIHAVEHELYIEAINSLIEKGAI